MSDYQPHDIVQVKPDRNWGACLVVVTEVRGWGVIGYTQIPRGGQAFIRLPFADIEGTEGRAVFIPAPENEEKVALSVTDLNVVRAAQGIET